MTGADKLLDIINSKGEISLDDASRKLNVPRETIIEWGDSLENQDLITSNHTFRNRFLISKDEKFFNKNQLRKLKQHFRSVLSNGKSISREEILKSKEKEINKKFDDLHERLQELKELELRQTALEKKLQHIKQREEQLALLETNLDNKSKVIEAEKGLLEKRSADLKEREARMMSIFKQLQYKANLLNEQKVKFSNVISKITAETKTVIDPK